METTAHPPDVASNASIAMLASLLYLATRLLLPPLVLHYLSLAQYGLWSTCFILIMYIGLTDVGFSSVYVRLTAQFHARGDIAAINRLLSTGVVCLLGLAAVVLSLLWLALPALLQWLQVAPAEHATARTLILGTAAIFLLDLSFGAYCYVLHGLQRIRAEKAVAVAGFVLEPLLLLAFLAAGLGILSLLLAFALRYLLSLAGFVYLAHRFLPGLALGPRHFDRGMLRHFLGFGVAVQASTLLSTALFSLDRVLAGFLLGPQGIALFELAGKLPIAAAAVPGNISNVAYPAAARHALHGAQAALRSLYLQASRATSVLCGLPLGFLAGFAAPIMAVWLGQHDSLAQLPLMLALCTLPTQLHITTGPGSALFRANGQLGNEFVYHALRLVALAACCTGAVLLYGGQALALAAALALGTSLAALAYLWHNQRRLAISQRCLLTQVLLPGLLPYGLAWLLHGAWRASVPPQLGRLESMAYLAGFGVLYTLAWAACTWRLLHPHERQWLRNRLPGARPPLLRAEGP